MPIMSNERFLYLSLACLLIALPAAPARAVPMEGVYAQGSPAGVFNLQTVAHHGAVQVDYIPSLARFSGNGSMQVLQAAARFPAPIIESGLTLRGLLGYQQQWAYYDGVEDTYGGINVGLASELHLGSLPFVGEFMRPVSLCGYGFGNRLITAKANGQGFATNGLILPAWGGGVRVQVPTGGHVYLGTETFSLPAELGTGQASFSQSIRYFSQFVLGYRW